MKKVTQINIAATAADKFHFGARIKIFVCLFFYPSIYRPASLRGCVFITSSSIGGRIIK